MPDCVLRVSGPEFDPDDCLPMAGLRPYRTWRRGDPLAATGRRSQRYHTDGGFCCGVSGVDGDLGRQVIDAGAFLVRHRSDLQRLTASAAVACELDFGVWCRVGVAVTVQSERLPASFLLLAGELGVSVTITLYPPARDDD